MRGGLSLLFGRADGGAPPFKARGRANLVASNSWGAAAGALPAAGGPVGGPVPQGTEAAGGPVGGPAGGPLPQGAAAVGGPVVGGPVVVGGGPVRGPVGGPVPQGAELVGGPVGGPEGGPADVSPVGGPVPQGADVVGGPVVPDGGTYGGAASGPVGGPVGVPMPQGTDAGLDIEVAGPVERTGGLPSVVVTVGAGAGLTVGGGTPEAGAEGRKEVGGGLPIAIPGGASAGRAVGSAGPADDS